MDASQTQALKTKDSTVGLQHAWIGKANPEWHNHCISQGRGHDSFVISTPQQEQCPYTH